MKPGSIARDRLTKERVLYLGRTSHGLAIIRRRGSRRTSHVLAARVGGTGSSRKE